VRTTNHGQLEQTLRELRRLGRVEKVDAATVQSLRSMAFALDEDPSNAALWRQYHVVLRELTADDDDGSADAALAELFPEVRDEAQPERESFGGELTGIGAALGQPFMPHQRDIAMVGGRSTGRRGCRLTGRSSSRCPGRRGRRRCSWRSRSTGALRRGGRIRSGRRSRRSREGRADKWLDELFR